MSEEIKLPYKIKERYSTELNNIQEILTNMGKEIEKIHNELLRLGKGKIYELNHTPGYPSYITIANDIKNGLDKLLNMIENDEESILDKLRKIEKKE